MDLDPLSKIAIRCGGDKFGSHVYTPIYHKLFHHLRDQPIKLFEIGIGGHGDPKVGGSSLRTWAEYFPEASIVGLDIAAKALDLPPNVRTFEGSQADGPLLQQIVRECGPFDIVVDDGSHHVGLTQQSFMYLYPTLAENSIYVVEDTQTAFREGTGGDPSGRNTIFDVAHAVSLSMHVGEGFRLGTQATSDADPVTSPVWANMPLWHEFGGMTESVSVFRNLVVFQRGRNMYPSNSRLDFSHPEVLRNYQVMAELSLADPAPRDSLARIDMNIWAGRYEEAAILAMTAAKRYPDDISLLHELRFMMEWAGRASETEVIRSRLRSLDQ